MARSLGSLLPELPRIRVRLHRVLLIDDTPEIAELLTFSLRDHGYEVFASGFTESVNELLLEQHSDAVVLDCSVFEMSAALFDSVRHHPDHAEFPVACGSAIPAENGPGNRGQAGSIARSAGSSDSRLRSLPGRWA